MKLGTLFGTDASHCQEGDLAAGDTSVGLGPYRNVLACPVRSNMLGINGIRYHSERDYYDFICTFLPLYARHSPSLLTRYSTSSGDAP